MATFEHAHYFKSNNHTFSVELGNLFIEVDIDMTELVADYNLFIDDIEVAYSVNNSDINLDKIDIISAEYFEHENDLICLFNALVKFIDNYMQSMNECPF